MTLRDDCDALDRQARARGWATMADLLSDEPVHSAALASQLLAPVACPRCGKAAPAIAAGAGRDLHECACGAYSARWWCCGLVEVAEEPTAAYREGAICPGCGVDRFGVPARFVPLVGGVSLEEYAARCRESEEEV